MLLTLDRGNSTLDVQVHGPARAWRARLDPADPQALATFVAAHPITAAVGLSVVPHGLDQARELLRGAGVPLLCAGVELPCPLATRYPDPASLGVDRWVGAVAAHARCGAVVTIDCGTATTVNAIDAQGVFLGGAIAPGAATMARGLALRAPALPEARLGGPFVLPAVTSVDAVGAGVALVFAGGVDRLVSEVAAAADLRAAARIVTGGEAELYLRWSHLHAEHVPDLVHQGLQLLWMRHSSS